MSLMNSGVMSLTPDRVAYDRLIATLHNKTVLAKGTVNDQDVLTLAFPEWHKLPYPEFGAQITHCECEDDPRMWDKHQVRLLHFTAGTKSLPKPWDYDTANDGKGYPKCVRDIYLKWWGKYSRSLREYIGLQG